MSRSFGDLSFTTLPPMSSSPEVMSSSPAIMLRVVDFPHPDGPTRMTNSPSAMSRLMSFTATAPSGKRLEIWSKTISAIACSLRPGSALDGARCQPGDDPPLEEQHEDDDRNGDDHRGRRDRPRGYRELRTAGEEGQRGRRRPRGDRRGQRDGQKELIPAEQEHQDGRGDHAGRRERGDDPDERLEWGSPVHLGRFLQLPGDLPEERGQRVDPQRQAERDVRDDQPDPGVEDPERPLDVEQRRHSEMSGNIAISSDIPMSRLLPGNCSLATA